MRALAASVLIFVLWTSIACGPESTAPRARVGDVSVTRVPTGVRLVNLTGRPVEVMAFERSLATTGSFALCVDISPACLNLQAGGSRVVPLAQIAGFRAGAHEAVVWWWHVVPSAPDGYRVDKLRSTVVQL